MGHVAVDDLFVQLIGDQENVRLGRDPGKLAKLVRRVHDAGRIGRGVDDDRLGFRRECRAEPVGRDLVALLGSRPDGNRRSPQQGHHFGIADPVGGGNDHFIPRIQNGHHRVEEGMFASGGDQNILRGCGDAVLQRELLRHRLAQLHDAGGIGVVRKPACNGLDAGPADHLGSVEVRLSRGKRDHIFPFATHLRRAGRHSQRRGRLYPLHAGGKPPFRNRIRRFHKSYEH